MGKGVSRLAGTLLVTGFAWLVSASAQNFALHEGDRVVFYGDSITAQRLYTRYAEDIVLTRYPEMHVDFWNAGVGGDTVRGGYTGDSETRLKRDLFPHHPTVVTMMLGMNDGGYGTFHQDWFDGFLQGYHGLLREIDEQDPGVRVTVIKPTTYDEITHGTEFPGYGSVVSRYADGVATIGAEPHRTLADFDGPMTNLINAGMKDDRSLAQLLIPDRIHPGEAAHWVMAAALARAWGVNPTVSAVHFDARAVKMMDAQDATVSGLAATEHGLSWTQTDRALPLPLSLVDPMMLFVLKNSDLAAIDQQMLRVDGLSGVRYELRIDGKQVADFKKEQLSTGVNLALYRTPMEEQSRDVDGLEQKRTKMDETRFLLMDEDLHVAGSPEAAQTLELAEATIAKQQHEKAQPKPHQFELVEQ